jgi:hypothetical protein
VLLLALRALRLLQQRAQGRLQLNHLHAGAPRPRPAPGCEPEHAIAVEPARQLVLPTAPRSSSAEQRKGVLTNGAICRSRLHMLLTLANPRMPPVSGNRWGAAACR